MNAAHSSAADRHAPAAPSAPTAEALQLPAKLQCFLAIDLGMKRTGLAFGSRLLGSASPRPTVRAEGKARLEGVAQQVREWEPDALVIGVPRHPDGTPHEMTAQAQKFARQLQARFGLPVFEVDERYSTTEAHSLGVADPDAGAACVILEQFFRSLA
jgi:putative Holliday junction resolvase